MQDAPSILDVLAQRFPDAKKTTLRDMIAQKRVLLNGHPARSLKQSVTPADRLDVQDKSAARTEPESLPHGITLLYQDADLLVVDKPAGLLTATDAIEKRPTLLAILDELFSRHNAKAKTLLVHRLDRDASGILVFARGLPAYQKLKSQFAAHTIDRHYIALVHGRPKKTAARLEHHLREDDTGRVHVIVDKRHGRQAVLDYQVIGERDGRSRLRVALLTGRKHQIRVQLKAIGCPLCGDAVYGPRRTKAQTDIPEPPGRLALHAAFLALTHPRTGKRIEFRSPPPASFDALVPAD